LDGQPSNFNFFFLSLGQGPTEEIKEERRKEAVIRNKEAEQQLANFNFRI